MDILTTKKKLPTISIGLDYTRLSRDRKKLSEKVAIQHCENTAFIEDQSWEYGKWYQDNDISASEFGRKTRDDYWRMIKDIQSWPDREGCEIRLVIVVTEIPRLYRQLEELLDLIKLAEPEPGRTEPRTKLRGIWTTDGEGYDLSTPEGYHRALRAVNNGRLEVKRASKRQLRKRRHESPKADTSVASAATASKAPRKTISATSSTGTASTWLRLRKRLPTGATGTTVS